MGSLTLRFGWGVADQLLSSATNFLLGFLVARAVTPADFGAFAVVYAVYTLSIGAVRSVIGDLVVVRYSSVNQRERQEGARRATGTALYLGATVGIIAFLFGFFIETALVNVLGIVAVLLPLLLVQDVCRFVYFADGRGDQAFFNDAIWAAVMLAAMAVLSHTGQAGVASLTAAWALGGSLAALIALAHLSVLPAPPRRSWKWFRSHRDLGDRFVIEFAISNAASHGVVFGVGAISGLAQLGQLRAGHIALGPIGVLFSGAGMAMIPECVKLLHESQPAFRRLVQLASLIMGILVAAWGTAILSIPAEWGIVILGSNWSGARQILFPLVLGIVSHALVFGPIVGLRAMAQARRSVRARTLDAAATLVCVLSGAILAGAVGAAWGYAAAGAVRTPNWWLHFVQGYRQHLRQPAGRSSPLRMQEEAPRASY